MMPVETLLPDDCRMVIDTYREAPEITHRMVAALLSIPPRTAQKRVERMAKDGHLIRFAVGRYRARVPGEDLTRKTPVPASEPYLASRHLVQLAARDQPITCKAMAAILRISRSTASHWVGRMVDDGVLVRVRRGLYRAGPAVVPLYRQPPTGPAMIVPPRAQKPLRWVDRFVLLLVIQAGADGIGPDPIVDALAAAGSTKTYREVRSVLDLLADRGLVQMDHQRNVARGVSEAVPGMKQAADGSSRTT